VLFLEHKLLYPKSLISAETHPNWIITSTRERYPTVTIKNSTQKPDVTLIAYGGAAMWLEPLLDRMTEEEIYIQICLPSSVQPVELDSLSACCAQSDHVILVEESTSEFNWSAEIAAQLQSRLWGTLKSPIHRIASKNSVIPAAKPLEEHYLPSTEKIENAIFEVLL